VCYLILPSSSNKHIIKHLFFFFSDINKPVIVSDDYKHFMLVIISNNHNSYKLEKCDNSRYHLNLSPDAYELSRGSHLPWADVHVDRE